MLGLGREWTRDRRVGPTDQPERLTMAQTTKTTEQTLTQTLAAIPVAFAEVFDSAALDLLGGEPPKETITIALTDRGNRDPEVDIWVAGGDLRTDADAIPAGLRRLVLRAETIRDGGLPLYLVAALPHDGDPDVEGDWRTVGGTVCNGAPHGQASVLSVAELIARGEAGF